MQTVASFKLYIADVEQQIVIDNLHNLLVYFSLQICCIEPLCASQSTAAACSNHPVVAGLLFAMASTSKLLVVSLRPSLKVHYKQLLTGSANTLPLLAWHFVSIQISKENRSVDPVLLFARDQYVCFLQVVTFFLFRFISLC